MKSMNMLTASHVMLPVTNLLWELYRISLKTEGLNPFEGTMRFAASQNNLLNKDKADALIMFPSIFFFTR